MKTSQPAATKSMKRRSRKAVGYPEVSTLDPLQPCKQSLCAKCRTSPLVLPAKFCENCREEKAEEDHLHRINLFNEVENFF